MKKLLTLLLSLVLCCLIHIQANACDIFWPTYAYGDTVCSGAKTAKFSALATELNPASSEFAYDTIAVTTIWWQVLSTAPGATWTTIATLTTNRHGAPILTTTNGIYTATAYTFDSTHDITNLDLVINLPAGTSMNGYQYRICASNYFPSTSYLESVTSQPATLIIDLPITMPPITGLDTLCTFVNQASPMPVSGVTSTKYYDAMPTDGTWSIINFGSYSITNPGGTFSSSNPSILNIGTNSDSAWAGATGVGTATITYSATNGCGTFFASKNVVVLAPISIPPTINGASTTIVGSSVTLTGLPTGGIWMSLNPSIATVNSTTGQVIPIATGGAGIAYILFNHCSSIESVKTVVVLGAINGDSSIGIGGTTTLHNLTAGGIWASGNPSIATVNSSGIVTGIASGTTTIYYTYSYGGTSSAVTKVITVNGTPSVDAIIGHNSVCAGSTISLYDATTGGTWSSSNPLVAAVSNSGIVTGVSAGTDTIIYTVTTAYGTTSVTKTIIVNGDAPVLPAITGPDKVCMGTYITLVDSMGGGIWTSADTTIATVCKTNCKDGIVTGVGVGIDTIRYSVTNSCGTSTIYKLVTVGALPIVKPILGNDTICVGTSTTLTDSTVGGTWASNNIAVATISSSGVVHGVSAGYVTISYAIHNTCNDGFTTVYKNMLINSDSVSAIAGTNEVCIGATTNLYDATSGGVWSSSNPAIATINIYGMVTAVSAGVDTIYYTVANSCGTTTVSKAVSVNITPVVTAILGNGPVCVGAHITLSDTTHGGIWATNNSAIATVDTSGVVTGITAGYVTISCALPNSCGTGFTTVYKDIVVNGAPIVFNITGANRVCKGSTITLHDATPGGVWASSDSTIAKVVDTTGVVSGIAAGLDTISYTVTGTCGITTITKLITVDTILVPLPAITGKDTICAGATTTLHNATPGGVWASFNPTIAAISNTGLVTGVSSGHDTISYSITNACGIVSDTIPLVVNPYPAVATITGTTTVCVGAITTLQDVTPGGVWSISDSSVATVDTNGVVTGITAGIMPSYATISYSVNNSCGTTTVTRLITVSAAPYVAAISGSDNVCKGSVITLSDATANGIWSSADTTIATVNVSGSVSGVAGGSTIITYIVTTGCGTTSVSMPVSVDTALPVVTPITGLGIVCIGDDISLSDSTLGGVWTSSNTGIATVDNIGTVTATGNGSTNIVYTISIGACSSSATWPVLVNCDDVCSGSTGGVESKSLGDVMIKRIMFKMFNSISNTIDYNVAPKFGNRTRLTDYSVGSNLSLRNKVPQSVIYTNDASITSPTDLTSFTNAIDVLSVDYTSNNTPKAVAFATTTLGSVYTHTKPVCDRLKGAALLDVENVNINGYNLIRYKLQQSNGAIEYALSFSIGKSASGFSLQSNWFTTQYLNADTLYNFQLWAIVPEMVDSMAKQVIGKVQAISSVGQSLAGNAPATYIISGNRQGTNLNLLINNTTANTSGYLELQENQNETSTGTNTRIVPLTLNPNGTTSITVPEGDTYESNIYMYVNGQLSDLLYMNDGAWSTNCDANSTISKFNVINDTSRKVGNTEYPLLRNVEVNAVTSNYVSVVRALNASGMPEDLSAYKGLQFTCNAAGVSSIQITLTKQSITNWSEQYTLNVPIQAGNTDYYVSLNNFKSTLGISLSASDITAVTFSYIVNGNSSINTSLSNVGFTQDDVAYQKSLQSKAVSVYPNPSNGQFMVSFNSDENVRLTLKLVELGSGKVVYTSLVDAITGLNNVAVNFNDITTNVGAKLYIVVLEGDNIKYSNQKILIDKQ